MSFQLMVQIQTQAAEAAVARVEQGLGKATVAAKHTGAAGAEAGAKVAAGAVAAAAALAKATAAARAQEDTLSKLARYANPFAALNAQFEREAGIVERIRGPLREYNLELVALDKLHRRGALSTAEFAAEMEHLTKAHRDSASAQTAQATSTIGLGGAGSGAPVAPSGPGIGAGIQGALGGAAALGITEGISKVKELAEHFLYLRDAYIEANNTAVKFVDSSHDVNQIVSEQIVLAHDLHSNYRTTIDLYDAVRDGTDELNYSHGEQIQLLKTLGEAAQVAGKPLESVGSLVSRLTYAAARGHIEQRELNMIMREVPEIATNWMAHFKTTRQGLTALVDSGKIKVGELLDSLITSADGIHVAFGKIQRTAQQETEAFSRTVDLFVSKGDSRGDAIRKAIDVAHNLTPVDYEGIQGMMDQMRGLRKTWADVMTEFVAKAEDARAASIRAGDAIVNSFVKDLKDAVDALPLAIDRLKEFGQTAGIVAGIFADPWGSDKTGLGAQFKLLRSIKEPVEDARKQLANLKAEQVKGQLTADEYQKAYEGLITTINGGRLPAAIKLWHEFEDPIREASERVAGLNALFRSGYLDAQQYNAALLKGMGIATAGAPALTARQAAMLGPRTFKGIAVSVGVDTAATKLAQDDGGKLAALVETQRKAAGELAPSTREYNDELAKSRELVLSLGEAQRVYKERLDAIHGAEVEHALTEGQLSTLTREATSTYDKAKAALGGYGEIFDRIKGPINAYEAAIRSVNSALHAGVIDRQRANKELLEAKRLYDATKPAAQGLAAVLADMTTQMSQQTEGFGKALAGTLVDDVNTFADAIATAASGGKVAWGDMVGSMISDIEKLIVKQLAMQAVMAFMGLFKPSEGNALDALAGTIFGAATGGSGIVGGSGGTDSQVVAFKATPGERVTIQTPEQQRGGAPARQAAPAVHIHNHFDKSVGVAAIKSRDGASAVLNTLRANQGAVRSRR